MKYSPFIVLSCKLYSEYGTFEKGLCHQVNYPTFFLKHLRNLFVAKHSKDKYS